MARLSAPARAKLNLYLHILGRRGDGYHLMESLVAFTELADTLTLAPADELSLTVQGEFAEAAGVNNDNLVLKAARLLLSETKKELGAALTLTKNIPVGAGMGGGSADAAAALQLLNDHWQLGLSDKQLHQAAIRLGADVAMCLTSQAAVARGIGEQLQPVPPLPPLHVLLVHPRTPLLTAEVYQAYQQPTQLGQPFIDWSNKPLSAEELLHALARTRNDLQRAAIAVSPVVAEVLLALETLATPSPFVRMTGSGACCFALYAEAADAEEGARQLRAEHPLWWVAVSQLAGE